ncbi:hypothetical protein GCM10027270_15630 [Nocardioides ginkgobilobae]
MATDQTADQRSPRTVRRALVALGTVLTLGAVLLVEQRSSGPAGAEDMKDTPGERAGDGDGGTVRAGGADEGPRGAVTIALAGDVHLEGVLAELDDQSGSTLGPMSRALSTADVAVVNLESAISDGSLPMAAKELEDPGNRYWFSASPSVLGLMERSGVDAVSLANNHGADYGRAGLRAALAAAEGSPVGVVGVGRTPEEAYAPYRTSVRGTDIAVLAADASPRESAERTWAIGPGTGVGMAAARRPDAPALLAAVRDAAARDDVVVVYLHWGEELQVAPTDDQRALAESLAEAGADVVVGAQSHVLQGAGMLGDTYVGYGLGNFAWYHGRQSETGVLRLTVRDGEVVRDQWVPGRIPLEGGVPQPLERSERPAAVAAWRALGPAAGLAALDRPERAPDGPSDGTAGSSGEAAAPDVPAEFVGTVRPLGPAVRQRMLGVSHRPAECPLGWDDLRLLRLSYVGYDGVDRVGRMVVAREVAQDVVGIFRDLHEARFPIRRMKLVDAYGGDDDRSMAADNTSAYNCRAVTGGSTFSDHAYGKAIDINPVRNPYVLPSGVLPPAGRAYADVDRSSGADAEPGVIVAGDVVVRAFTSRGWEWGASFADYQHFSTN